MATNVETPAIYGHTHTHSLYDGGGMEMIHSGNAGMASQAQAGGFVSSGSTAVNPLRPHQMLGGEVLRQAGPPLKAKPIVQKKEKDMRRYVQIFLADPDPRVPIDKCLIHSTEPKMTELDDNELFFDVDVRRLVDHYNETVRTKVIDKTVKDREVFLEPARIRDLAMNVTTIAKFGG